MHRVIGPFEQMHENILHRLLVLEADTREELAETVARALEKGWLEYVAGSVPEVGRFGAWMLKPVLPVEDLP